MKSLQKRRSIVPAVEIKFLSIFDVVEEVLDNWDVHDIHSIEDVISADKNARIASASAIQRFKC